MYAVFISGGKQYKAIENQTIQLEKLNYPPGTVIEFNKILIFSSKDFTKIGTPFLKNGKIKACIENHGRSKKIKIIKFNRRKHYKKTQGHRQNFTNVKIIEIRKIGES